MTWSRKVAVASGERDSKKFELLLANLMQSDKGESSGLWGSYLAGRRRCFFKWEPRPKSAWVETTESVWRNTSAWFLTPVWYLMEDQEFLPSQIAQCAELLPDHFREILVTDGPVGLPKALRLRELQPDWVYYLAGPISPWALGAMACAYRRAELSGQRDLHLSAAHGMLWLIDQLVVEEDPWVREPLMELRKIIVKRQNSISYGYWHLLLPKEEIGETEPLDFFGRNLKQYLSIHGARIDFEVVFRAVFV